MQTNLPAAAQRPVDLDQAQRDFALGLRQRVLERHQVLLQEGDAGQVGRARRVLGQGDVHRLVGVGHAGGLGLGALLGPQELHQPVLHFLIGVEHRFW